MFSIPFYSSRPITSGDISGQPFPWAGRSFWAKINVSFVEQFYRLCRGGSGTGADPWLVQPDGQARVVADKILAAYQARLPASPATPRDQSVLPRTSSSVSSFQDETTRLLSTVDDGPPHSSASTNVNSGKRSDADLLWACYHAHTRDFWQGTIMLVIAFSVRMTIPLLTKAIIDDIVKARARAEGDLSAHPRPLAHSVCMAVAVFAMMVFCFVLGAHSMLNGTVLGSKTRAGLVDMISRKSLLTFDDGRINTFITADAGYAEMAFTEAYIGLMCPPVILIGCVLVVKTIGIAGLVGIAVITLIGPTQFILFRYMLKIRKKHLVSLDARTQLLTEVVRNLHSIKLFAYEGIFSKRIAELRGVEAGWVRKVSSATAAADVFGFCMPAIAAVVAFTTYSALGNELDLGRVFATLQFFNFIQQPITWFPRIFATLSNILNASRRLQELLAAEEREMVFEIDCDAAYDIDVKADFYHESLNKGGGEAEEDVGGEVGEEVAGRSIPATEAGKGAQQHNSIGRSGMTASRAVEGKILFLLRDIDLRIPRGSLVCIVGRVGSGKTALLSGLIGDMKRTSGSNLSFGGRMTYVPQATWIQSGSIRENITFCSGSGETDEEKLSRVIHAAGLQEDLASFQDGVDTNIGEKGITLSGGQKQRVCIARAAYADSDMVLLDDPLSAVDAHVANHLLHNCILSGPLADRTRILVTHHLDVLPHADLVVMMQSDGSVGHIVQQGTYEDLMSVDGPFQTLIREYGTAYARRNDEMLENTPAPAATDRSTRFISLARNRKDGKAFILDEDCETGSVALSTYIFWLRNMGSLWAVSLLFVGYVMLAGARVASTLILGLWQADVFDISSGAYQAIYAAVAYALTMYAASTSLIHLAVRASIKSCNMAVGSVLSAPTAFLDRTPTGRIVSRLCKDVESSDTGLTWALNRVLVASLAFVGSIGLVAWTLPWMCLIYVPCLVAICYHAVLTQPGNREVKRRDALARSRVYASFAEQLMGTSVIRAFGRVSHSEAQLQQALDQQNRFTYLSKYMRAWLLIRVSNVISTVPAGVALYGVIARELMDPVKFAVTLTYVLASVYTLQDILPMVAQFEQEMICVERIMKYCHLTSEDPPTLPSDPPAHTWPSCGGITFTDVNLRYRPDLPLVLKGLTFDVRPGEKVGILGRTGAGKSSLVQAIYRTVELYRGRIEVDGIDLGSLGLHTLRSRLSIIPQEPFLFGGTIRDNIDPSGLIPDSQLNAALSLIHSFSSDYPGSSEATLSSSPPAAYATSTQEPSAQIATKLKLDTPVLPGGSNFSAGEKQLISLLRALVRGSKVLIMDEATSSVDAETDAVVQRIIQREFADVTLLSIAHRLQTVAYYDRVLVLDDGMVAEYDTPLNLYDRPESIFRSLCNVRQITRDDLLQIQADAADTRARGI